MVGLMICMVLCSCGTANQGTQGTQGIQGMDKEEPASQSTPELTVPPTAESTDTPQPDAAPEAVYQELIGSIRKLILEEVPEAELGLAEEALNGILDAGYSKTPEETLDCVGYALWDLNEDGMPELVVGGVSEERDGAYFGRDIYAVYTCVDGEIYCVCSGWARSYVGWLGENVFYYSGSAGAAYSLLGQYVLAPNAAEWTCIDFYFTEEDDIYYNQTGIYEKEAAKLLDMTAEEFWALNDERYAQVLEFELTPFTTLSAVTY